MGTDNKYMVATRCYTFNHAPYIEQTLKGFAMQETTFPVVYCIVDDASTDGEQRVLREWADKNLSMCEKSVSCIRKEEYGEVMVSHYKENKNVIFVIILLKENHYKQKKSKLQYVSEWLNNSKYHALCEGDDYWTDPYKLQIQVSFLENHIDYSICSHRILKYDEDTKVYYEDRLEKLFKDKQGVDYTNRSKIWLSETASTVYRREAVSEYERYPGKTRDNVRTYFILKKGKGFCLSSKMSVYRQHSGGIFSKQSVNSRLLDGSYLALKELYEYEHSTDARVLYYRCYAYTFLSSRGKIFFSEKFNIFKFLSLIYYIPSIFFGVHPVYKKII